MVSSSLGQVDCAGFCHSVYCFHCPKADYQTNDPALAIVVLIGCLAGSYRVDHGQKRVDGRCGLCEANKACLTFCICSGINCFCILDGFKMAEATNSSC